MWEEPTAFDVTDPNPVINKTDGPSLGDVLSTGRHVVVYQASDATGNLSPACTIEIRIQGRYTYTAILQWLEHLWNHENIFETGVVCNNKC